MTLETLWENDMSYVQQLANFSTKGQIISKRFFLAEDSPKKRRKTRCILVKTNSFVRFFGRIHSLSIKFCFRN